MRVIALVPFLAPVVLLAACTGKTINMGDDTGDTADDTADDVPPDFTFALTGDWPGSTLTLTWLDFTSLGSEQPQLGAVAYSALVEDDSTGVPFGVPPEADMQEIDPDNAPGMMLAGYLPGLHLDADGDGLQSGDETYAGVGLAWPIYVTGTIPTDFADMGFVEGWNALEFVPDGALPVPHDITAIPLAADLAVRTSITVGGSYTGEEGASVVFVSSLLFEGETVDAFIYDGALSDPWSVTLDGPPDADHFSELEGVGMAALEVPIAYMDSDGSGGFTDHDTPLYAACSGGLPVGLLYLPGITDLLTGWSLTLQGVGSGWVAMSLADSGGVVLTDAQAQDLAMDASCTL